MDRFYFTVVVEEESKHMAEQLLDCAIKKKYKEQIEIKSGVVGVITPSGIGEAKNPVTGGTLE